MHIEASFQRPPVDIDDDRVIMAFIGPLRYYFTRADAVALARALLDAEREAATADGETDGRVPTPGERSESTDAQPGGKA